MTSTKMTIHVQGMGGLLQEQSLVIGERAVRLHKIPTGSAVTLQFGAARHQVKVVSASHLDGIRIGEPLADKLGLHHGSVVGIRYKASSKTLSIGPLIGVMMSRVYSGSHDRPFGNNTTFCKELTDTCRTFGAFVYFFTASDVGSGHSTVKGWAWSGRSWYKADFPVPDVVYNRLTTRKLENDPGVQQFMREVRSRHGAAVFNEKYLDKTDVFEALKKDASLLKYLPESHMFKNFQMLKSMSSRHQVVFLKPITGSLGKGIIRIARLSSQSYSCQTTSLNGTVRQTFPSLEAAFGSLSGKLKQRRYQIQQGLHLIETGGRPIDFRALVQRGSGGAWGVTSIVARIAGSNHFVSNLARGGSLSRVKEALAKTGLTALQQRNASVGLRKAALDIAGGIEKQVAGHFGELGVDLAVDMNGKVWLLEVNSKPSKNDGTPLAEGAIRPSVKQTVLYARYLAGF
ncbi:YheC/YheD family protein [Paenibacillus ginsengarvi]|uniref:YheC/YheD family protein n=1 Tax=Paenibacillus ginsengarvi TaxID=400777 RepID=A0A3B0CJZ5_9BACL|nr:YheC/YheD family protein [Paenibacillus ginsengarvi]RKN85522.1 YheC/YheD family protein [Paenibacillus ginsengarvi]